MSPHAHTRTHTHAYTHTLTHTCTVPALRPNWPAANRATQTPQPAFPRVLWKTDWHCPAPAGSVSQKSRHAPSSEGLLLHTQPARPPTPKEPPNESLVCQLRVHRHAWALPDDLTVGQTGGDARKSRSVCGPDLLLITDSWGSGGPAPLPPPSRHQALGTWRLHQPTAKNPSSRPNTPFLGSIPTNISAIPHVSRQRTASFSTAGCVRRTPGYRS